MTAGHNNVQFQLCVIVMIISVVIIVIITHIIIRVHTYVQTKGGWSTEGIRQESDTSLPVLCSTTHLTSFSVLVSARGESNQEEVWHVIDIKIYKARSNINLFKCTYTHTYIYIHTCMYIC